MVILSSKGLEDMSQQTFKFSKPEESRLHTSHETRLHSKDAMRDTMKCCLFSAAE